MNSQDTPNNKIYNKIKDYKYDKTCAGLNCKNSNTNLFQISTSMTICSVFLCDDCKRSLEHDGWILYNLTNKDNINKEHLKEGLYKKEIR